jgi:glucosamine--fructose-6-phosphate aminotransferase (isomerizing)
MPAYKSLNTCSKCLLPESFPNAAIDQNHLCSLCREYTPFVPKGEDELRKQLTSRHGETYDVVVPFSGGKDSTYILWYAKNVLQLRVIAVNYDSGLQSDESKENMRSACDRLNIPLVVKTVNYKRQIAMVHSILRIAEAVNGFYYVCGNCENGIRSSAVRVALEYHVPFVLLGDDPFSAVNSSTAYRSLRQRRLPSNIMKNKKAIPRVIYHFLNYYIRSTLQRREMGLSLPESMLHPLGVARWPTDTVELVHFFQFVPWNPNESISIIKEAAGWKAPKGKDMRFDCRLHCFVNHQWITETGFSHDGFVRSAHLRWGIISKEKAIADEEYMQNHAGEECKQMIKELGLKNYRLPGNIEPRVLT